MLSNKSSIHQMPRILFYFFPKINTPTDTRVIEPLKFQFPYLKRSIPNAIYR